MKAFSPEKIVYFSFCAGMALVTTGLPFLRYAVYVLPFWVTIVWFIGGRHRIVVNRETIPFIFLISLSIISLVLWDFNTFKKAYFIMVFLSVFLLFDFSRVELDLRYFGLYFVALGLANAVMMNAGRGVEEFSLAESRSMMESTFAFPLGLVALFFFVNKKYLWSLFFAVFVVLFLKRVVLLALFICVLVWFVPRRIRVLILNPWTVMAGSLAAVVVSIAFTQGAFDSFIFEVFDKSPNDFSKGRQYLWETALRAVHFSYTDFIAWGAGIGKVVTALQDRLHTDRILLHNDLLSLVLEIGIIPFLAFVFLFANSRTQTQRLFSLYMAILFSTDNVLIYQHVLFAYLFIQSQLARQHVSVNNRAKDIGAERNKAFMRRYPAVLRKRHS